MQSNYEILGLTKDRSDADIEHAYLNLRAKYSEERFFEGDAGNEAAKKLTELDTAYNEIIEERRIASHTKEENGARYNVYDEVEKALKAGDINNAQTLLDNYDDRDAEWHYLQSVVFYKKNWVNDSKKQLEIAMDMDPNNEKYKTSYDKLCAQIKGNEQKNFATESKTQYENKYTGYDESGSQTGSHRQMGGDGCLEFCCQMAICNVLLNCCCNCR